MSGKICNTGQSIDVTKGFMRTYRRAMLLSMAALLLLLPASEAAANCEDLIKSRTYSCRIKDDAGDSFSDCFRFTSPGEQSEDFDLSLDLFPGILGCDCQADGSFSDPDFGDTDSFQCVSAVSSPFGLALYGDVKRNGRRITGQGINDTGSSFVFRCDRVRTCEVAAPIAGAPSAGW
jgi:hypothetical protein